MNFKFISGIISCAVLVAITFLFLPKNQDSDLADFSQFPAPTQGETEVYADQVEGGNAREEWIKMSHRAAPNTDWEAMDNQKRIKIAQQRTTSLVSTRTTETFGNGNLSGEWVELGSNNVAGSLNKIDYVAATNTIYGVSAGGVLWSSNLAGTNWTPLNKSIQFGLGFLKMVNGGNTILAEMDKSPAYSTDGGATFTASVMDIAYVNTWGHSERIALASNGDIYYLRRVWDYTASAYRFWLYRSTDNGANFTRIKAFDAGSGNYATKMWQPLEGSDAIFVLHQGRDLYQVDGSDVELRNSNTDLTQGVDLDFEGNITGTDTTFFALISNENIFKSVNMGATWTQVGTTPVATWGVGFSVSPYDVNQMYMGAVDTYRSSDGGVNWTKVNSWGEYYGDIDKIHADIMDIEIFKTTAGTEFVLVGNHGGLHISYDDLLTTTNLSATGLNNAQYYDVRTDPTNSNYVYAGSQDQGHQRTSTASGAVGPVNFSQVISGDYGHMSFSRNGQSLWTIYPGAAAHYYHNPQTGFRDDQINIGGTHKPVSGWIFPTAETADANDNSIYIAGGNITGGSGSHLITLTAQTTSPYTITASQFSYDFRTNSNNGTSTISAIDASATNTSQIYVATDDGTFFYSNDVGTTWNKTASFSGPGIWYLYGSTILSSDVTSNLVWFGGSGYSNDAVWKSTDGGVTFNSMSNGMPNTMVQSLEANSQETLLFAATDLGPYVYVVADDMWYPMIGNTAPLQKYYSVEYVDSDDLVRFGTHGRGIWDFKISSQPLPVELISFDAQLLDNEEVKLTWATASETNNDFFQIEKSMDGTTFTSLAKVDSKGNGTLKLDYESVDRNPSNGENYYRLKQVDFDGKFEYSEIRSIYLNDRKVEPVLYPNPVQRGESFFVKNGNANMLLQVFDGSGKMIKESQLGEDSNISTQGFLSGSYIYRILDIQEKTIIQSGKILVL